MTLYRSLLVGSFLASAGCAAEAPVRREPPETGPAETAPAKPATPSPATPPPAPHAPPPAPSPAPPATDDPPPVAAPTPVVVRGVFDTEADRERFETDVLPSARAFLAYWAEAGLPVPHEAARLFISPPKGAKALEALPALYGDGIFDEMRALETAAAAAATNQEAVDLIDAFGCEHPPVLRKILEEVQDKLADPEVTPARIGEALRERREGLMAPDATFSFTSDNGEFELPRSRKCSYILLGHATDATRLHPYLEKEVVNHELGHALHYGLWLTSGPLGERLSSSANEALGDILAHVFDGDPCHGKELDAGGNVVGCRRRMDGPYRSVSDAVWQRGRGSHETGQSLRELIWQLRAEVPADDLKSAIRDGIAAVATALAPIDREPLSNVPVFDDDILAIRYRFAREYDASAALFDAVCARVGSASRACAERDARIGDPREATRASWLANAPTAVGAGGVALADGRRVAFELEGALLKAMTVSTPDGAATRYVGSPQYERDSTSGRVTLWFWPPGAETSSPLPSGTQGWTSDGTLATFVAPTPPSPPTGPGGGARHADPEPPAGARE